jgi:hypothetical protein
MLHIVPSYDDSPPGILKSNIETCFKIISGLPNKLQNHRQLPACRNKQFERVTGRLSDFIEASQNFAFYFLHNKATNNY